MKDATVAHGELSKNSIIVFKAKRTNRKDDKLLKKTQINQPRKERRLGQEKQHKILILFFHSMA